MLHATSGRGDPRQRRVLVAVLFSSIPAGLLGLAAGDAIKERLFEPVPIALACLMGGIVLVLVARSLQTRSGRSLDAIRWGQALVVGIAQWPSLAGVPRWSG